MQLLGFGEAPRLTVRRDRSRSILEGHPWVFLGALKQPPKALPTGLVVDLHDEQGAFLARGGWNDESQIVVRLFTRRDEPVDDAFIRRRIHAAAARRDAVLGPETTACRLIFAEADGLPGLIVDRYGDFLVLQMLAGVMEPWRDVVVAALAELGPAGIYERSEGEDRRKHEGLAPRAGVAWGAEPPEVIEIVEHGHRFGVDVRTGHKTGYYLDQRENRRRVARWAAGRRVLNAFAYTGGFGLYAAAAGAASVVHVDSSSQALELCRANLERNGLHDHELVDANVFEALRNWRQEERTFDLIVLDPPKFAASRNQLERASRGYRDLNALAFSRLADDGLLATFSCSGAMDPELFGQLVASAAADAGRAAQVVEVFGQPADHPVRLGFPESRYLTGLLCRVVD